MSEVEDADVQLEPIPPPDRVIKAIVRPTQSGKTATIFDFFNVLRKMTATESPGIFRICVVVTANSTIQKDQLFQRANNFDIDDFDIDNISEPEGQKLRKLRMLSLAGDRPDNIERFTSMHLMAQEIADSFKPGHRRPVDAITTLNIPQRLTQLEELITTMKEMKLPILFDIFIDEADQTFETSIAPLAWKYLTPPNFPEEDDLGSVQNFVLVTATMDTIRASSLRNHIAYVGLDEINDDYKGFSTHKFFNVCDKVSEIVVQNGATRKKATMEDFVRMTLSNPIFERSIMSGYSNHFVPAEQDHKSHVSMAEYLCSFPDTSCLIINGSTIFPYVLYFGRKATDPENTPVRRFAVKFVIEDQSNGNKKITCQRHTQYGLTFQVAAIRKHKQKVCDTVYIHTFLAEMETNLEVVKRGSTFQPAADFEYDLESKIRPFFITGRRCIERGITIQSDQTCFYFNSVIIGNVPSPTLAYQLAGRANGISKNEAKLPVHFYTTSNFKNKILRCERFARKVGVLANATILEELVGGSVGGKVMPGTKLPKVRLDNLTKPSKLEIQLEAQRTRKPPPTTSDKVKPRRKRTTTATLPGPSGSSTVSITEKRDRVKKAIMRAIRESGLQGRLTQKDVFDSIKQRIRKVDNAKVDTRRLTPALKELCSDPSVHIYSTAQTGVFIFGEMDPDEMDVDAPGPSRARPFPSPKEDYRTDFIRDLQAAAKIVLDNPGLTLRKKQERWDTMNLRSESKKANELAKKPKDKELDWRRVMWTQLCTLFVTDGRFKSSAQDISTQRWGTDMPSSSGKAKRGRFKEFMCKFSNEPVFKSFRPNCGGAHLKFTNGGSGNLGTWSLNWDVEN